MKRIMSKLYSGARYVFFWGLCLILPVKRNRVVASNFYGRGYGDNPKYIVDKLLSHKELELIWLVKGDKDKASLPEGVIACPVNSFKAIYYLATARVWVDNCRKPFILRKRRGQFYMQTWHGFALKQIERDVADKLGKGYVKSAIKDSKYTSLVISDSEFMTKIYAKSFWYSGEIATIGSPRNDMILNRDESVRSKVFSSMSLPSDARIAVYAPTFRADNSLEAYDLDYMRLKDACERRFGEKFIVLVRLHPNIMQKSTNLNFDGVNVVNASFYPDMQELLCAADVVISDYSSLMFDFALSLKPCFQFATDIDEYKNDRNFYFEIDNLPFVLARSNDELESGILSFDEEKYREDMTRFFDSVGMVRQGDSAEKCAQIIVEKCSKSKKSK